MNRKLEHRKIALKGRLSVAANMSEAHATTRQSFTPSGTPPPKTLLALINKSIETKGALLKTDEQWRRMLGANINTLYALELSLYSKIDKLREGPRKIPSVFPYIGIKVGDHGLNSVSPLSRSLPMKIGKWAKKRKGWLRLFDHPTLNQVVLDPTLEWERICQDPRNAGRILGRFSATVGLSMNLNAIGAAEFLASTGTYNKDRDLLTDPEELVLQMNCLSKAIAQFKEYLELKKGYSPKSLLGLAERTIEMAVHHMLLGMIPKMVLTRLPEEYAKMVSKNLLAEGALEKLHDDSIRMRRGVMTKDNKYFLEYLRKSRDNYPLDLVTAWPEPSIEKILDVSCSLGILLAELIREDGIPSDREEKREIKFGLMAKAATGVRKYAPNP